MLRLDPGEGRIRTARQFRVWEGGGEYNVARGLRRCFGLRTAVVTALADNEVGRLVEDLILQGGVDTAFVQLGARTTASAARPQRAQLHRARLRRARRGRASPTAATPRCRQLRPGDVDWDHLFGELGVRWLHTGGIFAGLSTTTPDVVEEAMRQRARHGTVVSYDLNYRPEPVEGDRRAAAGAGGQPALAPLVDVMIGNEEDFTACLGFDVPSGRRTWPTLEAAGFRADDRRGHRRVPELRGRRHDAARGALSATVNDWGAIAWSRDTGFVEATHRAGLEILDRVGGGDSFASGLIYGLLTRGDSARAVEYGAAHGALAMTTPGDTSMASLAEVEALIAGSGARVQR